MKRLHTYSQNFLRDPRLIKELIGHTNIRKSDVVYDIGAGSGTIASVLAGRCKQVIAIEYEQRTVKILNENMRLLHNVTVINADFMTFELPRSPYKIMANIPFHLSSPIVRKLTEAEHPPLAIYLIVQRQFAQKLLMDSDHFTGLLGAFIAPWFTARIRQKLQRTDFSPQPAVDTAMIELLLREEPLLPQNQRQKYQEFVEKCFSRQKYFAELLPENIKRPSEFTTTNWVELFKVQKN